MDTRCRSSIPDEHRRFISSPKHPTRLWVTPTFPFNEYRGLFPRRQSGRGVNLTTHRYLVLRLKLGGAVLPLPHTKFYILLTVHHVMILGKWPTWRTISSMYLFTFLTLYMFRAHRAHHQERKIVSMQPLVAVTLCRWLCRVQVRSRKTSDLHTTRLVICQEPLNDARLTKYKIK